MIPIFSEDASWSKLVYIMQSWEGTPYRHLWMRKGRGADCSLVIGAVFQEFGIVTKVEHAIYPKDWFMHSKSDAVRDEFAKNIRANLVPGVFAEELPKNSELMRGDIVTFCIVPESGVASHGGIMLDPPKHFFNSIQGRGVSNMQYGAFWIRKLRMVYRMVYNGN